VVVADTATPEILAFDITDLEPMMWTVILTGESAAPGIRTQSAFTLLKVAAYVLRPSADGVFRANALHVVDFEIEPPVESGTAAIPDLRGVVGMQGNGNPFVAWTSHTLVRVPGDTPDPAHLLSADLGAGGDIALVVAQP